MSTLLGHSVAQALQLKHKSKTSLRTSLSNALGFLFSISTSRSTFALPRVLCFSSRVARKLGHIVPESATDLHFPAPLHFWVLFLAPLPLLLYFVLPALKIKSASLLIPNIVKSSIYTKQEPKKSSFVNKKSFLEVLVQSIIWLLLLASLSSPQLVGKAELKAKNSRNFLIVADLSFSMAQKDWKIENKPVTRWEAVTTVMDEFIEKREGDRIGLVLFGSNAYVQAPFTPDLITVKTHP